MPRSTEVVLVHHLSTLGQGVDAILEDYCEESVLITQEATHRGLDEIRAGFAGFTQSLPPGFEEAFTVKKQVVDGELAYLVWEALPWFPLGTDTFVIRDGKILAQTVTVHPAG